jgi:NTE family protein
MGGQVRREDPLPETTRQKLDWLARDIAHLKVGLALGSGGSGGYAHLGVVEVLRRVGVPFDVVTGCSIGAAIAAGIAAGYCPKEIKEHVDAVGRKAMQPGLFLHSLLSNRGIIRELRNIIGERSFGDLTVPMGIVAADVFRGEEVVLRKGSAWRALVASMAIPGIYPPILVGGRYLVDGGVVIPASKWLVLETDIASA